MIAAFLPARRLLRLPLDGCMIACYLLCCLEVMIVFDKRSNVAATAFAALDVDVDDDED